MGHSDIPWERDHWLGEVDPRPLAMLRVGMGVVLLQDIATRWPHRRALLSDEGMLPRGVQGEPWAWSLFDLFGAPSAVSVALLIGAAIAILLTIGFHTRIVTPLAWLFTQSLQNRNLFVGDGGDDFLRVLLFWASFTDLGAIWSLDARRLGPRRAPALGARLLALQVALVYAAAGLNKLRGSWLDPDIVYQSLQHLGYLRPPGEALLAHPGLCRAVARFTLVAELTIPALIVSPFFVARCRGAAIILNIALQAGLFLTLRVGIWTGLLLITSVLFLQPAWLDRVAALTLPTKLGKPGWPSRWPSRWDGRHAFAAPLAAALVIQMAAVYLTIVYQPRWLDSELKWVGLNQGLDLFSRPIEVRRWRAPGELRDGRTIDDVLPLVEPELQATSGWLFSRWTKFRFKGDPRLEALARYFCRRHAEKHPHAPLASFTLVRDIHPPARPSEPAPEVRTEILHQHRCGS